VAAGDIELVIVACSNLERPYPAVAVELQAALGAGGFAFDMNVACSSATFAIETAANAIRAGSVRRALIVNPEICSAHLNFRDRDSHFIFGDACTAIVVEDALSGVRAGRAGHFGRVVGVARHDDGTSLRAAGADVVVHDLEELIE